jgi:N-acyl homoserine lactone hydrolase
MVKLYVLDGGDIICRDNSQLNKNMPSKSEVALANPIFLIHHPKGTVLWDAGLPDALVSQKNGVEAWIFHLSLKKTLISQLTDIGFSPERIDYFAFSHTHVDHTGNANYFKNSILVMQKLEFAIAFDEHKKPYNYDDYKELKNCRKLLLDGDQDLFGDGTVRFIFTPGHTPGHQSLIVTLKETGPVIISGDVSYYTKHYKSRAVPVFNVNAKDSLTSIEKLSSLQKELHAQLWIQHDKQNYQSLKHSPLFYQ